jgi:hypothetical protein
MNHRLTQIALTTLVCTSSAWATTWIVDDNGGAGVQFTDIPPAIAAAQPGDVLLVAAGNYSAFILDKGLTIIGYSEPSVQGLAEVVGVQAGQRAALIGLRPTALHVDGCAGSVVLQDLLRLHRGTITNSNDVRLRTVELYPGWDVAAANGEPALVIAGARVEVVESFAYGNTGTDCFGEPSAARGGAGITLGTSARVHVAISRVYGGHGGWCTLSGLQAMDGGPALRLDQPSEVVISGPDALVHGGDGGVNLLYTRCGYDGIGACAVEGVGNVWHSGATIEGGHTD